MAYHPFRDLGLKFLAIGLAVLLWLTVAGEPMERGLRVPLELENIPEGTEIGGDPPETVDVRVRGSSGILSRLESGEVVAVLDLSSARQGSNLFHLVTERVRAPFGVEVTQVVPATVELELEPSRHRVVPVLPAVEGEPAPGYVVGEVSSVPATVEVVGPESRLRQLTEAMTEPVSVANATSTVREVVTVGVPDKALRLREPLSVRVTVDIVPAPTERTLLGVPVRARNLAAPLTVQIAPSAVTVVVRGSRDVMRRARSGLDAFVDLAGLEAGSYDLPVQVEPPREVEISNIAPPAVHITIK